MSKNTKPTLQRAKYPKSRFVFSRLFSVKNEQKKTSSVIATQNMSSDRLM
jgi:hypothetical protein